ncbi:hypothetical protein ACLB2K_021376 [Fragaria x ananassa]
MASSASLPSSIESSSSSAARPCKYDVFLSFRGLDTQRGITSQLYDGLQNKRGIATFMDDQNLEVGDAISPTLIKAIEESWFAIVVLSPNYASSTWCLEELAKICEWMEGNKRILPLFYNVEPTDVRYQKGSFEVAFSKYESSQRHRLVEVQQWRKALNKVASFSGWDSKIYKTDTELVEKIVDFVVKKRRDDNVTPIGVYGMGEVRKNGNSTEIVACERDPNSVYPVKQALPPASTQTKQRRRASRLYKEIMRKDNIRIGGIAVGASLSTAGNSPWISPSGDFAFGFRQLENNDLFLLSIWFAKIPDRTIVWYANGDKPAPNGSDVTLTANSGLVLTSPQGEQLWKSNQTTAGVVAHAVMNDTGNFVLEDEKSEILWETFKNPTDTMLPGQILERGGKLSSRRSETDYSRGSFQLDFQDDGNLVFTDEKPFYSTKTTSGTVPGSEGRQLVFNASGDFYILRVNGGHYTFTTEERSAGDYYL